MLSLKAGCRSLLPTIVPLAFLVSTSAQLNAQTLPSSKNDTASTALSRSAFDDLPSSGTVGGLLETLIPEIISDRIEGGGLSVGSSSRLGARGSSWTQNAFQLGGLDLTDPGRFGGSLLFLDSSMLEGVEIATAMMPVEQSAPGVSMRMIPRRPTEKWGGRAEFFSTLSHPPASTDPVPPISTLHTWNRVTATASGPMFGNRAKAMFGVAASNASRFDRADPTLLHSRDVSGVTHIVFAPSTRDEVSVVGAAQSARVPLDGRLWLSQPEATQRVSDLLMAVGWRRRTRLASLTADGGFWNFAAKPETASSSLAYIDSIQDRQILDAVSASQSHQQWSANVRAAGLPDSENRWLRGGRAGLEFGHASASDGALLVPAVAESVEAVPARLWRLQGTTTEHSGTTFTAYAAEMLPLLSRLTMDAGVRTELMTASASTGASIQWIDVFPRVSLRWNVDSNQRVTGILGLGRYGHRLPLELLNYGDPAAASADVFRWIDRNGDKQFQPAEQGALVARAGAGPSETSVIDPGLQRPTLTELLLGVEVRPSPKWAISLSALARQEHHVMAVVNDGAPIDAYTVTMVPDPGGDLLDPSDDQHLPIYNRRPETFGADHYILTNPDTLKTTHHGIELNVRYSGDRLWIVGGASAGRMEGPAAARGFHVFQNDAAIPTDAFSNPNAATFTHGTAFSDRGYTIKTAGTYRFAHDVRVGIVARYQDGQPFSRLVLAPDLNQGAEAIRAYRAARTRFTYTLTADARVQIPVTIGRQRLDVVWDLFNFVNRDNEVEEWVVTGPAFRTPTALQPRPVMHLGVRVPF